MASNRFLRLRKILVGAITDAEEVVQLEGRLERFVHFWALVTRQFIRGRCFVRASALSYSTLLAVIPLLVVALNVTSSLLSPEREARLTQFVEKSVARIAPAANIPTNSPALEANPQAWPATNVVAPSSQWSQLTNPAAVLSPPAAPSPESAAPFATVNTQSEVARTIHELVQKAGNGALGVTGIILLIVTSLSLLRGIEETFNDLWGVTRARNWFVQITLYWMIISLGPLLLSTALGLVGSLHLQPTRTWAESSPLLAPVVNHLLPVAILSLALCLLYKLTPNTKVEFGAALLGGVCSGVAWHVYNQLGFLLVAKAMSASRFYGGVFLIVLVMGGLYVLWLIILFGSQIAYAYQNRSAYLQDRMAENVNQRGREFVALRIMTSLGRRFQQGLYPATVPEIAGELAVPSRLTQSVLRTLTATRLVLEVAGPEAAFLPARPLESINAHDILIAMRTGGGQELPMPDQPELAEMYGEFARIERAEREAASKITLLALANRALGLNLLAPPPASESMPEVAPVESQDKSAGPLEVPPAAPPTEPAQGRPLFPEADPAPRRETARPDEHPEFPL
jgi:membrane protein